MGELSASSDIADTVDETPPEARVVYSEPRNPFDKH